MTCSLCKKTGAAAGDGEQGISCCWCGVDVCDSCLEQHATGCHYLRTHVFRIRPKVRPVKFA